MWLAVLGQVLINSLIIMSIVIGMLLLVQKWDVSWNPQFDVSEKIYILLLVLLNGGMISCRNLTGMESLLLSVFAGSLLFACITDVRIHQVYSITWWIAGAVGMGLFFVRMYLFLYSSLFSSLLPLFLYGVMQECFFCKMYGRADCHAFLSCAVVESAFAMHMKTYLVQMLVAIVLLAVVQLFHKNINKKGNLITPVPFLPYITLSFWIIMSQYANFGLLFAGKNDI